LNCTWDRLDLTGGAVIFETLKRRKRGYFRGVPIPPDLLRDIGAFKPNESTGVRIWPVSRATAYRWIVAKMKEARIEGTKACPKGLRHAHAVACIGRNIPLTVVKKWLGHARLETTAVYLDFSGDEERELAKRLWSSCKRRPRFGLAAKPSGSSLKGESECTILFHSENVGDDDGTATRAAEKQTPDGRPKEVTSRANPTRPTPRHSR
jgi:hypothetical protein